MAAVSDAATNNAQDDGAPQASKKRPLPCDCDTAAAKPAVVSSGNGMDALPAKRARSNGDFDAQDREADSGQQKLLLQALKTAQADLRTAKLAMQAQYCLSVRTPAVGQQAALDARSLRGMQRLLQWLGDGVPGQGRRVVEFVLATKQSVLSVLPIEGDVKFPWPAVRTCGFGAAADQQSLVADEFAKHAPLAALALHDATAYDAYSSLGEGKTFAKKVFQPVMHRVAPSSDLTCALYESAERLTWHLPSTTDTDQLLQLVATTCTATPPSQASPPRPPLLLRGGSQKPAIPWRPPTTAPLLRGQPGGQFVAIRGFTLTSQQASGSSTPAPPPTTCCCPAFVLASLWDADVQAQPQ